MMFLGLDTATAMGIALWRPSEQLAFVLEVKGTPVQQMQYLTYSALDQPENMVIGMESIHTFLNAKTTRSLLERYGYIKHSLLNRRYRVIEVPPRAARKSLGVKTKQEVYEYLKQFHGYPKSEKLTNNHTDALAVALYVAKEEGFPFQEEVLQITGWKYR